MIDGKKVISGIIKSHSIGVPVRDFLVTDGQIKQWVNDSYEKTYKGPGVFPLSKLSWNDDALDSVPLPPVAPSAPVTPAFNADHAWDMVVLAARASRYE